MADGETDDRDSIIDKESGRPFHLVTKFETGARRRVTVDRFNEEARIKIIQKAIGIEPPTGIWGAKTNEQFTKWLRERQAETMGIDPKKSDGWWGADTQAALEKAIDPEVFTAIRGLHESGRLRQLHSRNKWHQGEWIGENEAAAQQEENLDEETVVAPEEKKANRATVDIVENEGERVSSQSYLPPEARVARGEMTPEAAASAQGRRIHPQVLEIPSQQSGGDVVAGYLDGEGEPDSLTQDQKRFIAAHYDGGRVFQRCKQIKDEYGLPEYVKIDGGQEVKIELAVRDERFWNHVDSTSLGTNERTREGLEKLRREQDSWVTAQDWLRSKPVIGTSVAIEEGSEEPKTDNHTYSSVARSPAPN